MKSRFVAALLLCLASAPFAVAQVSTFTGGDAGEGLDLDGTFRYAVNARGPAVGLIRDANFTTDGVTGVSISAETEIPDWSNPNFGATTNDDRLETVMQSIRWSSDPEDVVVTLSDLIPGRMYKLQLLFTEVCCERGFDVLVNGNLIVNDFSPNSYVAYHPNPTAGVVITHSFFAFDDTMTITLDGTPTSFPDKNPTLSGFTLEEAQLPEQVPALDTRGLALLGALLAAVAVLVIRRA